MKAMFIWVSRHKMDEKQISNLKPFLHKWFQIEELIILDYGDVDAFNDNDLQTLAIRVETYQLAQFKVFASCVHPRIGETLITAKANLLYSKNINRAPEGEKPQFKFEKWVR